MACATAWMSALLARMAERPGRERLINVADESWKIVQHTGLGEWFQSNFKLARQFGVMNLVVLHKLADLQRGGRRRLARGADRRGPDRRRLDPDRLPPGREPGPAHPLAARPVRERGAADLDAVGRPGAVARRQPLVRRPALPLAPRDRADEHRHRDAGDPTRGAAADERAAPRRISDAVLLAVDREPGAGSARRCGCGAAWPGRCSARLAARRRSRSCSACSIRLPGRLADPAARVAAAAVQSRLPGAGGFYAALALLAGAGGTIGAGPRAGPGRARSSTGLATVRAGRGRRSSARCAATARSRRSGRLVLGRHGGRLLYAEHRHALVAFGPPQSGKSAGLAIPALLEWDGPAVASSIKTDLLGGHAGPPPSARARCSCSTRSGWLRTPSRTRGRRCTARAPGTARSRSRGGWPRPASSTTAASRAATSGRSPPSSGSRRCCTRPRRAAPAWTASSAGSTARGRASSTRRSCGSAARPGTRRERADAHAAYDAVRAFEAQADRTRTSIEATAQALLRAYRFQRVLRSAATQRDHRRPAARRARRRCT